MASIGLVLHHERPEAADLAREAIGELELEVEKTHAKITIDRLPVICAVPALIRQLFYNLISNALKFRRKNVSPVIHIKAEKISPAKGDPAYPFKGSLLYKIYVSDNGIGFDPQYADEIFMVFKRLHSHQEIEGTGVGLSICKKIVEKHSGFIVAQGKPGEGSTFVIGLPKEQPELVT